MRLIIAAWQGRVPQKDACIRAARQGVSLLEQAARYRGILSTRRTNVPDGLDSFLAEKMIRSTAAVGGGLTPMAAVAGAIADGVADWLEDRGMTKVIVNNGGDIAIRTLPDEPVRVGLRPDLATSPITDSITLEGGPGRWGVATSGLEGRSLTRGVASAATVIAGSAAMADAAATALANASFIQDESVRQVPARELDDQSDIPDLYVTVQAGPFSEEKKRTALNQALDAAEQLIDKDLILGAWVVVDGKADMTDFVRDRRWTDL
jgi:hypothetical protein